MTEHLDVALSEWLCYCRHVFPWIIESWNWFWAWLFLRQPSFASLDQGIWSYVQFFCSSQVPRSATSGIAIKRRTPVSEKREAKMKQCLTWVSRWVGRDGRGLGAEKKATDKEWPPFLIYFYFFPLRAKPNERGGEHLLCMWSDVISRQIVPTVFG